MFQVLRNFNLFLDGIKCLPHSILFEEGHPPSVGLGATGKGGELGFGIVPYHLPPSGAGGTRGLKCPFPRKRLGRLSMGTRTNPPSGCVCYGQVLRHKAPPVLLIRNLFPCVLIPNTPHRLSICKRGNRCDAGISLRSWDFKRGHSGWPGVFGAQPQRM